MVEINRIYNCDCRITLRGMDDNMIDVTVTSPPYNVGINYDNYNDNISIFEYTSFCEEWISLLYDKTKTGGRFCLNIPNIIFDYENRISLSGMVFFTNIALKIGWFYREDITWVKLKDEDGEVFAGGNTAWGSWLSASNPQFRSFTEQILVFHKGIAKKEPIGESDITKDEFLKWTKNAWFIMPDRDDIHPAIFPIQIPYRCIKIYSYVRDLVYDPFCGKGTTIDAAKRLNRNYLGSEISTKYFNYAQSLLSQQTLF